MKNISFIDISIFVLVVAVICVMLVGGSIGNATENCRQIGVILSMPTEYNGDCIIQHPEIGSISVEDYVLWLEIDRSIR